jgi:hypothetical protein
MLSAAQVSSLLSRFDQTIRQSIHDGTILEVMKKEKRPMVSIFSHQYSYLNCF